MTSGSLLTMIVMNIWAMTFFWKRLAGRRTRFTNDYCDTLNANHCQPLLQHFLVLMWVRNNKNPTVYNGTSVSQILNFWLDITLEKSIQIDFQAISLINQCHNDIEECEDAQLIERSPAVSKKLRKKLMNLFNGQKSRSGAQSDPGRHRRI